MFYYPKRHLLQVEQTPKKEAPKKTGKKVEYGCEKCGLNKTARHPKFEAYGNLDSKLMIIGSSIDGESDKSGIPFSSESSKQYIRANLLRNKINLKKDCVTLFAVSCWYKKRSDTYPRCCRERMAKIIKELKPNLIIALGADAANSIMGIKEAGMKKISSNQFRNRIIPNHEFNCLVYPMFEVDDVVGLTQQEDGTWKHKVNWANKYSLEKDFKRIISLWRRKYHKVTEVRKILRERNILSDVKVTQVKTIREFYKVLERLVSNKKFAFDYETTNPKPFDSNFDVHYMGFGLAKEAWVIHTKDFDDIETAKALTFGILQDETILKYDQNEKFEELCSRYWMKKRGIEVIKNSFCTMLATHVVDERQGCTSLDFQNLTRFGIVPYGTGIYKYIHIDEKDKKVNEIQKAPVDDMVLYCGYDVITTYHNGEVLNNVLLNQYEKYRWCYDLLYHGAKTFADVEEVGFNIDDDRLDELEKMLLDKKNEIVGELIKLPSVKSFFNRVIKQEEFETFLRSPKQMQKYLYEHQKLKPFKRTKSGYAVDEEVINHHADRDKEPLCMKVVQFRKVHKAKNTYVDDLRRNINEDGRIHASINLHTTETNRSSITDPALQTLPVHDDIIEGIPWRIMRDIFIPTTKRQLYKELGDFILAQVDYSGFELFIGAGISGDKKFIRDVNDIDVHAREAVRLFELDIHPNDIKKKTFIFDGKEYAGGKHLRFEVKNNCVFATVYGSVFSSIARNLRNVECFMSFAKDKYKEAKSKLPFSKWVIEWSEEHVKKWQIEQFFGDYKGLQEFQESEVENFKARGFVELPMGFRRHHPLDRNKIINTPTQGTAFLTLLYACIEVNKQIRELIKKENFKSRIILETHDDMTFDAYKPELYELIEMVDEITLHPPIDPVHFDFAKHLKLKNEWSFGYKLSEKKDINMRF